MDGGERGRLRRDGFSGIAHLRNAYGGMGSVNDILPLLADSPGQAEAERARALRAAAWDLAAAIRRDIRSG